MLYFLSIEYIGLIKSMKSETERSITHELTQIPQLWDSHLVIN